jgi:hypothetical protein
MWFLGWVWSGGNELHCVSHNCKCVTMYIIKFQLGFKNRKWSVPQPMFCCHNALWMPFSAEYGTILLRHDLSVRTNKVREA